MNDMRGTIRTPGRCSMVRATRWSPTLAPPTPPHPPAHPTCPNPAPPTQQQKQNVQQPADKFPPTRWGISPSDGENHHLKKVTAATTTEIVQTPRLVPRNLYNFHGFRRGEFFEMVIFPIWRGNSPSRVLRGSWELLRGKKKPYNSPGANTRNKNAKLQINWTDCRCVGWCSWAFLELTVVWCVGRDLAVQFVDHEIWLPWFVVPSPPLPKQLQSYPFVRRCTLHAWLLPPRGGADWLLAVGWLLVGVTPEWVAESAEHCVFSSLDCRGKRCPYFSISIYVCVY